jgi:Pentapeptide repeats (8 copies)
MPRGFKFVAADCTTRDHTFSYLDALKTGDWVVASAPTKYSSPCPGAPGDGLCVAHTVTAACSGGQSASSAVGLVVSYEERGILAEGDNKTRVRRLKVVDMFDPMHLIRLGLCANLRNANLRYANLSNANLSNADLRYADLRYADLSNADLRYANLRYANLRYANLSNADLRYADLSGADLRYANLSNANLSNADLRYADLRYADLSNANLSNANLRYAINIPASAVGGRRT